MFKYSLCFSISALFIFLLKGDETKQGEIKEQYSIDNDEDSINYDFDYYDGDFDYDDIDLDNIDYDTLLEIEKTLDSLSKGDGKTKDKEPSVVKHLRANIDGLQEVNDKDDKKLTEEDLKRGFKITNLKYLKNFEPPDAFPDDIQERIK